jgi:hypothetical protein
MAILCCQNYLPPSATVEECLLKYYELKLREIDEIGQTINHAFIEKLNALETMILTAPD